jgi:release factor glutamine methyltransferase
VPSDRAGDLPPDVRADPALALFDDGDLFQRLLDGASAWLRPGGVLVVEIDDEAGTTARDALARSGFVRSFVLPDLNGRDRVCVAVRPDVG